MFDRVAVEASELASLAAMSAAASAFGFERGRLLAMLPKGWIREVDSLLEKLPAGTEQLAARELLVRLIRQAVRCGTPFDCEVSWLDNALEARKLGRLEEIVATAGSSRKVPDLWTYISIPAAPHTDLIPHTIAGFEDVCRRLVELAPRAVIVDPYFDLTQRSCLDVLIGLIDWGTHGKCTNYDIYCRASEVFSKRPNPQGEFDKKVSHALGELTNCSLAGVRVYLLDDKLAEQKPMHRRVLLTAHGGVAIDYGFRLEKGRTSDASALAGPLLEQMRRYYYDGHHPYGNPVHTFEWTRRRATIQGKSEVTPHGSA